MPSRASGAKLPLSALFHLRHPEHAVRAGPGDRHAHAIRMLCHEHADEGVARGRVAELDVGCLRGDRERHLGDDLAFLESRCEDALEEVVGRDLALVGDDRRVQGKTGGGIIGGGIVVGDGAADGAAVAHMRIADELGHLGKSRNGLLHLGGIGDLRMFHHGADGDRVAGALDAAKLRDLAEIDQVGGACEPQLHGRQQRMPAGEELGVLGLACEARGFPDARGAVVFESVHFRPPLFRRRLFPAMRAFWAARHTA